MTFVNSVPTGSSLRRRMRHYSLTVAGLAQLAGVSERQIMRLIRNEQCKPRPRTRRLITTAFRSLANSARANGRARETVSRQTLVRGCYRATLCVIANRRRLDFDQIAAGDAAAIAFDPPAMRARREAVYLTSIAQDISQAELASALGMKKQSVSRMLRTVEDSRDDPAVDHELDALAEKITGFLE